MSEPVCVCECVLCFSRCVFFFRPSTSCRGRAGGRADVGLDAAASPLSAGTALRAFIDFDANGKNNNNKKNTPQKKKKKKKTPSFDAKWCARPIQTLRLIQLEAIHALQAD